MTSYILAIIFAAAMILIAALIATSIKFEGGSNPKDPGKRKMWFWVLAVINPIMFYVLGAFALAPNPENSQVDYDEYMAILPVAVGGGFIIYIVIGFILSKIFKNGKIGHWF